MLLYAKACLSQQVAPDDETRCRAAGISARALARWRADPRFREWLRAEIERCLSDRVWEIWAVVHKLAREGNLQAAKLHLARFDAGADASRMNGIAPDTFRALAEMAAEGERRDLGTEN